jgi:molybdopterin synthase sulfur carrier subunit
MKITVRFLGVHRSIVGKESIDVDIDVNGKIIDLVRVLSDRIGKPEFRKILIDPELEDPRPNNVVLVNGREINSLKGLETELHDGDEVVMIPVVHGG